MIDFENVSKTYGKNVHALRNLNLHIDKGEFVFIMGDSGSGKSTMIRLLLKEIEPTEGRITVDGTEITRLKRRKVPYYRRKLGVVFQDFRLLKDMNVYDNVAFAQRVLSTPTSRIRRDVPRILTRVGLSPKYKAYPNELSGGEQQRVAIARALVNKPDILLCDEPTGNLDAKNAWEVMQLLEEINQEGTTVVMVTHSQEIVDRMKKRVIHMNHGDLVREDIPDTEWEEGLSSALAWQDSEEKDGEDIEGPATWEGAPTAEPEDMKTEENRRSGKRRRRERVRENVRNREAARDKESTKVTENTEMTESTIQEDEEE